MPHERNENPDRTGLSLQLRSVAIDPEVTAEGESAESEETASDEEGPSIEGRDGALARAQRQVVEEHGKWPKGEAGYEPRSIRGQKCEECLFFQPDEESVEDGSCEMVRGAVAKEAVCNRYVESNS